MANNCSLAPLVDCTDADKTITNLIEQKGYISDFVNAGMMVADPLINLLGRTKMEFPEGQGDSITRAVLEVTSPNELDGLNWNPLRSNYPGNSACCNTFREFTYGNRTATGCLSQIGYKSPEFCKVDIVLKRNFMDQLMGIVMSMRNVSVGVWKAWLQYSYPKNVYNTTLSNVWGHPENYGTYDAVARPTTAPTIEHLDIINERIRSVGGMIGTPIRGYQVIVMGRNAFNRMKRRRMEQNAGLVGARSADFSLPNYAELNIPDLGKVITFSGYAFLVVDKPRRFREKASNETWDDAIIPSTIQVNTDRGQKTNPNPDYYNSEVALYEESLWLNLEAVDWLVPPAALAKDITVGGKTFFPALSYAGDFTAVHCPEDPLKKTVRFYAEFMAGMMSRFPDKGRGLLHLAVHQEACDDDDFVCLRNTANILGNGNAIRWVATTATAGQLNFLITGSLPSACPPGYTLFAQTEKGLNYPIGSIVSTTAFPGNSTYPQAGNYVTIAFPTGYNAVATVRELCDPWKFIICLPNSTPSSDPDINPCGVCNNGGTVPAGPCTLEVVVTTDIVRGITLADGTTTTIPVTNYTVAATLATAINTWLGSNGGGTATVTQGPGLDNNNAWIITIVGSTALVGASVVYDDGLVNTNTITFGQQGDCTPTS